jgi:hypothetical protein
MKHKLAALLHLATQEFHQVGMLSQVTTSRLVGHDFEDARPRSKVV